MTRYLVLAAQPWAQRVALPDADGRQWTTITTRVELSAGALWDWKRSLAFVLHWHWRIPPAYLARCPFIGFHASDLPHFRGGAPIDNQQRRGITDTQLTAFRLVEQLDAGPILLQAPLSLAGTKADVLARIAGLVPGMIARILAGDYTERPQVGAGSFYTRADADWSWSTDPRDCPVCDDRLAFCGVWPEHATCQRCGWVNDMEARDRPSVTYPANPMSLHAARVRWAAGETVRPRRNQA